LNFVGLYWKIILQCTVHKTHRTSKDVAMHVIKLLESELFLAHPVYKT